MGSVGAVGLSVDSPICRSVVRVRFPDSVQLVVSLGWTLRPHCLAMLHFYQWHGVRHNSRRLMLLVANPLTLNKICIALLPIFVQSQMPKNHIVNTIDFMVFFKK